MRCAKLKILLRLNIINEYLAQSENELNKQDKSLRLISV